MNKNLRLNVLLLILAVAIVYLPMSYATTTGYIAEPARPMPYTDFVTIETTAQTTIATITQILSNGGLLEVYNEDSTDVLRIGTDTNALTNGFGVPPGAYKAYRFYTGQAVYFDSSGSCDISYLKGN